MSRTPVAIAHDYLTQAGGAERVVLDLAGAFPDAPIYTTLYHPEGTFPEFAELPIRTGPLNRVGLLRRDHRLAFPALAPVVSRTRIDADTTIASSSGWAHGMRATGRLVVYCHAPARWLYQTAAYLGRDDGRNLADRSRRILADLAVKVLGGPLRRWDRRAAGRADTYLANSSVTAAAIAAAYGIEAEIVPPPPAMSPDGAERPVDGLEPGFVLCVARLLPYKNVDKVIEAMRLRPDQRLVVVGSGPDLGRLSQLARTVAGATELGGPGRISLLGRIPDDQLRWLYRNSSMLVAASFEDYGLTPLEAATFGKPTVALNAGGYLDTIIPGETGLFFDTLAPAGIAAALRDAADHRWHVQSILDHAELFSPAGFRQRIRTIAHAHQ